MRSKWKGPLITHTLYNKAIRENLALSSREQSKLKYRPIVMYNKAVTLVSSYLEMKFYVYNGHYTVKKGVKVLDELICKNEHLGHKLGEYVKTRKEHRFRSKKKKKVKAKK